MKKGNKLIFKDLAKYEIILYKKGKKEKLTILNKNLIDNNPEIIETILKMNSYIVQLQRENIKLKKGVINYKSQIKNKDKIINRLKNNIATKKYEEFFKLKI